MEDREDLITVLQMRFGHLPGDLIQKIYEINDIHSLQRLILSAANAADWDVFWEEFNAGNHSFRLVGENFNPLRDWLEGKDGIDGKEEAK